MDAQVTGQFKEWLEQDGRYDLADRPTIEIDDAEYEKALTHCARLHADYNPQKADAWAKFVVAAKNRVSATTREVMGGDAANSLTRTAASVETLTKEFRNFKGEFQGIASGLGDVRSEVGSQTNTLTEGMSYQTKAVWIALDASAKLQDEYTSRIEKSVKDSTDALAGKITSETQALWNYNIEQSSRKRRHNIWTWIWRIALILAILSLLIPRSHAQGVTQIRAIDPSTGNPVNITGVTSCATSHNCLDVNIQGVAHVICDSGCSGGGGGGGTSSNFGAAFPTVGTAAGASNGTDMEPLLVDGSGNLKVVLSGTSPISGTVTANQGTANSAANAWPTLVTDGTNTLFTSGHAGYVQFPSAQAVTLTSTTITGTVSVTQGTSPWIVAGGGTAGSPGTAVLTIQGVGSGTPVPISGTVTATPTGIYEVSPTGAANTKTNPFFNALTDGTNVITAAISAYGSAPTGTEVMGVNAFITNTIPVTGTFFQATQPVSCATAATCPVTATIAASQTIAVTNVTASNLNAAVVGTGTAGSPAGNILTVQGVASMTPLLVTNTPSTSGGDSTNVQQALTTSAQVKSSAGQVMGYAISNPNAATTWFFYYNTTSAPTIGSTTNLIFEVGIPAGGTANVEWANGIPASSGIYVAVATTATGNTAPGTGLTITTMYK
jgi:hypothetical protein